MKITPLEIRQKTFEKVFRGYDKEEVSSFLTLLSQEWEKGNEEKRMLQMRLEQSEKESAKLRQVEDSLFKTLKTAEDTGASMIEQANKTAELILKEAKMDADKLQAESKNEARELVETARSQAKEIMEDLRQDVAALIESYETLLAQREIVLKNLKTISTETLENINLAKEEIKRIDVTAHANLVKELSRQSSYLSPADRSYKEKKQTIVTEIPAEPPREQAPPEEERPEDVQVALETDPEREDPPAVQEEKREENPNKKASGSFFDQFD